MTEGKRKIKILIAKEQIKNYQAALLRADAEINEAYDNWEKNIMKVLNENLGYYGIPHESYMKLRDASLKGLNHRSIYDSLLCELEDLLDPQGFWRYEE